MNQQKKWINEIIEPKSLLVIAHPDDETIFAGGLISSFPAQWTIVCCVHEGDIRKHEFYRACEFLSDNSGNKIEPEYLGIRPDLLPKELPDALKTFRDEFDIVYTHNKMGEYGNEHHILVHNNVLDNISHENTWLFISPGSSNVNQDKLRSSYGDGNYQITLKPEIVQLKIRTFQECHTSQAILYGYNQETGKLRKSDLRETIKWEFESGYEEYTYYK